MQNATPEIQALAEQHGGELPAFAWPGGYPLFYFDNGGNVLCPACAQQNDEFTEPLTDTDINWENDSLFCDHCSLQIPSAYGKDQD